MKAYLVNQQGNSIQLDIYFRMVVYCHRDKRNLWGRSLSGWKVLLSSNKSRLCIGGNLLKGIYLKMDYRYLRGKGLARLNLLGNICQLDIYFQYPHL